MARSSGQPARRRPQRETEEPPTTATPHELLPDETGGHAGARYLFLSREGALDEAVRLIKDRAGVDLVSAAERPEGPFALDQPGSPGLVLDELGVVIASLVADQVVPFDKLDKNGPILLLRQEGTMSVLGPPQSPYPQSQAVAGLPGGAVLAVSPDYAAGYRDAVLQFVDQVMPLPATAGAASQAAAVAAGGGMPLQSASFDYMRGYRDGTVQIAARFGAGLPGLPLMPQLVATPSAPAARAEARPTETEAAWGLEATGVLASPYTGRGVAVAVLDTGLAADHPDFPAGRAKAAVSFVPGETAQDDNGHGTHIAGIICGPKNPKQGPRYGIAYEADLYVARVMGRAGQGQEWMVLCGLNWALKKKCQVVALPFGMVPRGPRPQSFWAAIGQRADRRGALLLAAAGGHSNRAHDNVQPVTVPANGGTVLGIGAVRYDMTLANFTNGAVLKAPGGVDLVGPGVNVRTAAPMPIQTMPFSGTSAATAYAAGIAALVAQQLNETRSPCAANEILHQLLLSARPLPLPATDVGKGLVQAPQPSYG
jgi:subtilisin family serine protease